MAIPGSGIEDGVDEENKLMNKLALSGKGKGIWRGWMESSQILVVKWENQRERAELLKEFKSSSG
jgi:hypothetical protein